MLLLKGICQLCETVSIYLYFPDSLKCLQKNVFQNLKGALLISDCQKKTT